MNNIKKLGKKQFLWGLLFLGLIWLSGFIPLDKLLVKVMDQYNAEVFKETILQGIGLGLAILCAVKLNVLDSMGFKPPQPAGTWIYVWPLILMSLLNIPESFRISRVSFSVFTTLAPYSRILFVISVGLVEEIVARGMISAGLLQMWGDSKKGIYKSAFISSAIFGAIHIGNYFMFHYTILVSLTQVIFASFFGIFFFALFVRTRSIWPGVIMHALVDLCAHLDLFSCTSDLIPPSMIERTTTLMNFLISVSLTMPLLIIGLFMLRKVGPEDLLRNGIEWDG